MINLSHRNGCKRYSLRKKHPCKDCGTPCIRKAMRCRLCAQRNRKTKFKDTQYRIEGDFAIIYAKSNPDFKITIPLSEFKLLILEASDLVDDELSEHYYDRFAENRRSS